MPSSSSRSYHRSTRYDRYHMESHGLDWHNQPWLYKRYTGITAFQLPEINALYPGSLSSVAGVDALSPARTLNVEDLSKILYLANGLTAKARQGAMDFYFRSAPSAGALYPNEIYLVWPEAENPGPGVFHCGVHNRTLIPLRQGNFMPAVWDVLARDQSPSETPYPIAAFMVTGIFFRSAWKYRRRAYRYVLMDAGHVIESLRLAIRAAGFSCRLTYTFDDSALNRLLGVDPEREVNIGCVYIYGNGKEAGKEDIIAGIPNDPLPESIRASCITSQKEIPFREISDIHQAGMTTDTPANSPMNMIDHIGMSSESFDRAHPLPRFDGPNASNPDATAPLSYAETVLRRRSRRNFNHRPIGRHPLAFILDLICRASDASTDGGHGHSTIAVGFVAGNVDTMAPGFYLVDTRRRRFKQVFERHMTQEMAAVCLDQRWLANAGLHFLFMTNLDMLDRQWRARGYRYAMATAGRLGHAVYLGATALGLGSCGIGALYDEEARLLLGLNAESALVYVVAAGAVNPTVA